MLKPDLDRLLDELGHAPAEHPQLPELERLVSQRLAQGEPLPFWSRFGLHVRVTAIVGAFLWGILNGTHGLPFSSQLAARTGEVFVEPAEFLAPDNSYF